MTRPVDKTIPLAKLETAADFDRTGYDGQTGVAIGWGNVLEYSMKPTGKDPPNELSQLLKKVDLPIISKKSCLDWITKNDADYVPMSVAIICTQSTKAVGVCKVSQYTNDPTFNIETK